MNERRTDAGTIISPFLAEGQLHDVLMRSFGHALIEQIVFDEPTRAAGSGREC